jgi:KaiC/GvpD/RAD55 family RecA-like ATPase
MRTSDPRSALHTRGVPIRTNVAPVYSRRPGRDNRTETLQAVVPAFLEKPDGVPGQQRPDPASSIDAPTLCWLDRLLLGGIVIPPELADHRALTILFSGPPGTCKSTLATELSYRLAQQGKRCAYLSSESPAVWLIDNAISFGWDDSRFGPLGESAQPGVVSVASVAQAVDPGRSLTGKARRVGANSRVSPLTGFANQLPLIRKLAASRDSRLDLLVLDSLDIEDPKDRDSFFSTVSVATTSGAKILLIVMDGPRTGQTSGPSDYIADMIFRFDRTYDAVSGYMLIHLEILKARYQPHILGRHQLKVYRKPLVSNETPPTRDDLEREMRAHPYLKSEGGIFIFPSVHYLSSIYKRLDPYERSHEISSSLSTTTCTSSRFKGIEKVFSGYPQGRSTALIGSRGTYKSHLAYVELLSRVIAEPHSRGLIVSLRDDEGVTRRTLAQILATDHHFAGIETYQDEETRVVEHRQRLKIEEDGKLEILYLAPGYITAEEFLHRLLVTVSRLKESPNSHKNTTPAPPPNLSVLFNSFDQLRSRFPLCARESMLIPAIVQMLDAEKVTSFFVAAKPHGQHDGLYGIESTAELILEVERNVYETTAYLECIENTIGLLELTDILDQKVRFNDPAGRTPISVREALGKRRRVVTMDVIRYPGCEAMGRRGFLELVSPHDEALFQLYDGLCGLHFIPGAPQPRARVNL